MGFSSPRLDTLIILQDGVYLELLIFNTPNPPSSHPWASRHPGWIDAADLGTAENLYQIINDRYKEALYKPAKPGGRLTKTPDGEERTLKWRLTTANRDIARGELPFFCEDITPREWRVPTSPPSNAVHKNGVLGVAALTYITPSNNFKAFRSQLTALFGSEPTTKTELESEVLLVWDVEAPVPILFGSVKHKLTSEFQLREARKSDEDEAKRGTGLWEVAFWVTGEGGVAKSKWGKIRYLSSNLP